MGGISLSGGFVGGVGLGGSGRGCGSGGGGLPIGGFCSSGLGIQKFPIAYRDVNGRNRKTFPARKLLFGKESGGSDGARTRDLRRDRPAL